MSFGGRSRPGSQVADWFGGVDDLDVQIFTSSGTWYKPSGTQWVRAFVFGAGGGGGAGRSGPSYARRGYLNGSGLVLAGTNYYNLALTPQTAAVAPINDIEIIVRVSLDDWTPTTEQAIIWNQGNPNSYGISYGLSVLPSGVLRLQRPNWTNQRIYDSPATGFTDGSTRWIRVVWDQVNGSNLSEATFYVPSNSADNASNTVPTVWQSIGSATNVDTGAVTVITANTGFGGKAQTGGGGYGMNAMTGMFYRAVLRSDPLGTPVTVFDVNFATQAANTASFTESSANAFTITINTTSELRYGGGGGGAAGYAVVELGGSTIPDSVAVTIGAGGNGGAAAVLDPSVFSFWLGSNGSRGGTTTFGGYAGTASGEVGGAAGTGTVGSAGAANPGGTSAQFWGGQGVAGSGLGTVNGLTAFNHPYVTGGGGGGGLSTTDTVTSFSHATTRPFNIYPGYRSAMMAARGGAASLNSVGEAGQTGDPGCGGGGGGGGSMPFAAGAGGNGGSGFVVVLSRTGKCDVQHFSSSGTWSKPVGDFKSVHVICVGAGGGGGTGCRAAAGSNRAGGSGGGGGGWAVADFDYASIASSVSVNVGAGGNGGTPVITDDTRGNNGDPGGTSSFGQLIAATGGLGGVGGALNSLSPVSALGGSPNGSASTVTAGSSVNLSSASFPPYAGSGANGGILTAAGGVGSGGGKSANCHFSGLSLGAGVDAVKLYTGPGLYGGMGGAATAGNTSTNAGNGVDGGGGGGTGAVPNGGVGGTAGSGGSGWVTVVTW